MTPSDKLSPKTRMVFIGKGREGCAARIDSIAPPNAIMLFITENVQRPTRNVQHSIDSELVAERWSEPDGHLLNVERFPLTGLTLQPLTLLLWLTTQSMVSG